MKQYLEMNDSGDLRIGRIPESWTVLKGKFFLKLHGGGKVYPPNDKNDQKNFFKVEDLNHANDDMILNDSELRISKFSKIIPGPLILIPKRGAAIHTNKVVITQQDCSFDSNIMGISIKKFNLKYFAYFLLFRKLGDIADTSTIPQLNNKHIYPLKFPIPPIIEQDHIVSYLDKKLKIIDGEILKNLKLIMMLQEKRISEINHAVTRGLNPTVQIKNSWIGDIPEYWNLKKVKFITKIIYGKSLPDEKRIIGDVPVYGSNGIIGYHNESISASNTIIIGRKGSVGEINYSKEPCFPMDTAYYIDKNSTDHNLEWIFYALQFLGLKELNKDSVVPGLSREEVYNLKLPISEKEEKQIEEEKQIADYLNERTKKIDSLILKIELQITNLQEFKQSLISSAVTGKIKVTQA